MKRIIAGILCFILVLSLVPMTGAAEAEVFTVYLDQTNGSDSNSGLTESAAVKTFVGAYKLL